MKNVFILTIVAWYVNIGAMMAEECPTMPDPALLNDCKLSQEDGVQKDGEQCQKQEVKVPAISGTTLPNEVQLKEYREARLKHAEERLQRLELTELGLGLDIICMSMQKLKRNMQNPKEIEYRIVNGKKGQLFNVQSESQLNYEKEDLSVWLEAIESTIKRKIEELKINQKEQPNC